MKLRNIKIYNILTILTSVFVVISLIDLNIPAICGYICILFAINKIKYIEKFYGMNYFIIGIYSLNVIINSGLFKLNMLALIAWSFAFIFEIYFNIKMYKKMKN